MIEQMQANGRRTLRTIRDVQRGNKATARQVARGIRTGRECNPEPQRPRRNQLWVCQTDDGPVWFRWTGSQWLEFGGRAEEIR